MLKSSGDCFQWLRVALVKTPAENNKSAVFANPEKLRVLLVHADKFCRKGRPGCIDCFFERDQKVADYIVSMPSLVDVIVELKGTDVMAAVEQIESTIPSWQAHERYSGKIGALIVSSKGASHPRVVAKFLIRQERLKQRGIKLRHVTDSKSTIEFSAFV
jgi:ribosomal protein L21E